MGIAASQRRMFTRGALLAACMTTVACVTRPAPAAAAEPAADMAIAWRLLPGHDGRQSQPPQSLPADARPIRVGEKWSQDDKFHWVIGEAVIPVRIDGQPSAGRAVGLRINGGDGGEVWVDGQLISRFDNDHPALVLLARQARPGQRVNVAIQFYAKVQGGDEFGEASWVIIDAERLRPLQLTVRADQKGDPVPDGIAGLSQGGGLADYEDATAKKLREGGFRWFRMDNILTQALKKDDAGNYVYDWTDFDRRTEFIVGKMGAEAIFAVSYMPQVLDAVENHDRQSAPRDYGMWEELCYQAARRALERGHRVAYWEVWNEVNTGWLKPGPQDEGKGIYREIYTRALGREQTEEEVNRRFEAYCKLYRATARGVLRADPKARVGGPALASGPMEHEECGHCFHGKGFARGLMLYCRHEKLPLDFVSWHEYFQPAEVFVKQVQTFREYLSEFPELQRSVRSYMITEWNEAWWADRPQDHELGAAWCANTLTRACIPHKIDRPCFFYVKQGDMNFRGDYSLLMGGNTPKASYNVLKMFNSLSGRWIPVTGGDDDVSVVACIDDQRGRLAVVLVNFRDRYSFARTVRVRLEGLPQGWRDGAWREWRVDATHSNVWHDQNRAELESTGSGRLSGGRFEWTGQMPANSVVMVEVLRAK